MEESEEGGEDGSNRPRPANPTHTLSLSSLTAVDEGDATAFHDEDVAGVGV